MTRQELDHRVALLKRLKENLVLQRDKFHHYLNVLDQEKKSIENGSVDHLQSQVALEESIVAEIFQVQKVIDPLEAVYRHAYEKEDQEEVSGLKDSLETLRKQVLEKNTQNRRLLTSKMEEVRQEILKIRRPRKGKSLYSGSDSVSSLIDINA
ncbi:MAG: hypothetical protein A2Z96_04670 [Spirochaetes bacterium GWB1_48_6]|nr:MAG: hypothetical protein A2Z96_04670 [Spirochaetes bacterium GWB1_48_6]